MKALLLLLLLLVAVSSAAARPHHQCADDAFAARIDKAVNSVARILGPAAAVVRADQVSHRWQDKYLLVEWMTDTLLAALHQSIELLGLTSQHMVKLQQWEQGGSTISLQFDSERTCVLQNETSRLMNTGEVRQQVHRGILGETTSTTEVKRHVTEYFWSLKVSHRLLLVRGNGQTEEDRITLTENNGKHALITTHKEPHLYCTSSGHYTPLTAHYVDITWLFKMLQLQEGDKLLASFKIDRQAAATPRRNPQVAHLLDQTQALQQWSTTVDRQLGALAVLGGAKDAVSTVLGGAADSIEALLPVWPMMKQTANETSKVLAEADANALLSEAHRQLHATAGSFGSLLKELQIADDGMFSVVEAKEMLAMRYMQQLSQQHIHAMDFMELMIRKQVVAAIGSQLTPEQFSDHMARHNRKVLRPAFAPQPFATAIRRSNSHSPEGTVSMEREGTPVSTFVSSSTQQVQEMSFRLDASTTVRFGGSRHLHAFLDHKWSGYHQPAQLQLVATARQFSGMIVLLGRIAPNHEFEPEHAMVVQNQAQLTIPLDLMAIPTPKEFKEAIESLSETQRQFAKAIRQRQLENTLFGIIVIQIKPQLERALNLPDNALQKEIALTQDLMTLFVEHQIPTDLLSFDDSVDNNNSSSSAAQLAAVKSHVAAMKQMIEDEKDRQFKESARQAEYNKQGAPSMRHAHDPPRMRTKAVPRGVHATMNRPDDDFLILGEPEPMMAHASAPMEAVEAQFATASAPHKAQHSQASEASANDRSHASSEETGGDKGAPKAAAAGVQGGAVEYTAIAAEMDHQFELLDPEGVLRPTVISAGSNWLKKSKKGLLGKPESKTMSAAAQNEEKATAFGLLDALTRGGGLPVEHATLHIVVAATHQFDKSLTETVVKDSINPIDRAERSALILASTVHRLPCAKLIVESEAKRISMSAPSLFSNETTPLAT